MTGPVAAAASAKQVELATGTPGEVGGMSVGVMGVQDDGSEAYVSVGAQKPGLSWSTILHLRTGAVLSAPEGSFQIKVVSPQPGDHGRVAFIPTAGNPFNPAILLSDGDTLFVGRENVYAELVAVRITALEPDAEKPQAAQVEWWPAEQQRADVAPGALHSARVTAGSKLGLGKVTLTVASFEAATPQHAARAWLQPG